MLRRIFHELAKRGYFLSLWYPRYQFQFFPRQLKFLLDELEKTAPLDGGVVEVGCAYGLTTTLLYEYLRDSGINKDYMCVDTFSGFTEQDIAFEKGSLGKQAPYETMFTRNRIDWFKQSLANRQITDISIHQADICEMDPSLLPETISFCLLDVDLYRPVKIGLEKIYPRLTPGGIIIVDDCWTSDSQMFVKGVGEMFEGAMLAYREFVSEKELPEEFAETKLAVLRKPPI